MGTWQDIFEKKIEDMNVTEPWTIQEDDDLQVHALKRGWKEFVQRSAFGRFQCSQCLHRWSSAKVHILFHMCRSQGRGTVRMRTFRQMCRRCTEPRLEEPEFSEETMEKLLHNLVLKILKYFYHVPIQPSELLEVVVDVPVRGPHDSAHCEGCQLGVCSQVKQTPGIQVLDDREPLMENKTRTHCIPYSTYTRPNATQTHYPHHPLPVSRNLPWKICCRISICVFGILAVLLFILIYLIWE